MDCEGKKVKILKNIEITLKKILQHVNRILRRRKSNIARYKLVFVRKSKQRDTNV